MNYLQKGELVFVRLLLPLMAGIISGFFLPPSVLIYDLLLLLAVLLSISLWLSIAYYRQYKIYLSRWKPGLIVHLLIFFISIALTLSRNPNLSASHFSKFSNEALVVTINSEPKLNNDILRFEAKVRQGLLNNTFSPQSGLLLIALKLTDHKNNYKYGDEILITGTYNEIDPPFNPYEFDYRAFLANRGILNQVFIDESQVRLLARHHSNFIIDQALALRKSMVLKYTTYIHDKEAASVASTLILGYKAELSREVLSAYSKTGTMHVLSVSGMHVGIVFFILNAMLGFLNRSKKLRIIRAMMIISFIWFYALITGFSPSVCRAALMLSFYVLGKGVSRSSNSYNLVAISAVLLLIYNPYFLFDVGFQLSYLAVLGLIYFYPKIYDLFYFRNWFGDKVWSYIALSCAAQLATFPLAMYYFHQFPVYFLLSNLFIVLPVIVIMYLGIAFLFIPWDVVLKPVGWFLEKGITLMDEGLFYIEKLPYASFSSYNSFLFYVTVYLIILGLALSFQYRSKRILYLSLGFLFLLISYQSLSSIHSEEEKSITFYSLRKNTAFGFFSRGDTYLFSDLDSANNTLSFSVRPSVDAKSDKARYLKLNQSMTNNIVLAQNKFFQFGNWKMMIWDKELNDISFSKPVKVDVLLLSGRPKVKLNELVKRVKFKVLMIDATNPDYLINQWVREASDLSLNYYVLKKNPAYSITLN